MLVYSRKVLSLVSGKTLEDYRSNEVLQLAVERVIEVVGEAARNVSREYQSAHPEIPWKIIAAQRHVLAHDYGKIIDEKIWRVATIHIPELVRELVPLVPPSPPDPEPDKK
jgi:uncharacterized protein with HEPN domain